MINPTSNPKLGLIKGETVVTDNGGLWAGINNEQYYGDDPNNQQTLKPFPLNVSTWVKKWQMNNPAPTTTTPTTTTTPIPTTTQTPVNGFDFSEFVSENKWFLLGGAALLGYMFLSGGLGATDRTITSVTRFAPKK
jgi:hypothetical protein